MKIIFMTFIICLLGFNSHVIANDNENLELDTLALASLLIKNNNLNRAQGVLGSIKDPNDVQTDQYYTLLGLLASRQKRYQEAIKFFKKAEKSGVASEKLKDFYLEFAKAYVKDKKFNEANSILSQKMISFQDEPLFFQLKAEVNFGLGNPAKGWSILEEGIRKFQGRSIAINLVKQKWYYLFQNKLFENSKSFFLKVRNELNLSGIELAQIAYQYRQEGEYEFAALIGELARGLAPNNEEIIKELARSYIELKNLTAAAYLFEELSRSKTKYISDASELWRKAGYHAHASRLALKIREPEKSIKQKMTLALDRKDFYSISKFESQINRNNLNKDENILYTLAYSFFMQGDYRKTEKYLSRISRKDLFRKATSLRETIEECERDLLRCL